MKLTEKQTKALASVLYNKRDAINDERIKKAINQKVIKDTVKQVMKQISDLPEYIRDMFFDREIKEERITEKVYEASNVKADLLKTDYVTLQNIVILKAMEVNTIEELKKILEIEF